MKTETRNIYLNYFFLFSITLLFVGCSIDDFDSESSELTDEELEIATEIIGESLSDQNEGIFSSLNDAFVIPSENGFGEQAITTGGQSYLLSSMAQDSSSSSQNERNFSYSYDPETGIHSVSFNRIVNRPLITKESSADLEYIFYDINGNFIESPRMENERVETVDYSAERTGSITTPRRTSAYQRSDLFVTDGLSATSGTIQIDGLHQGSGQFEATRQNGDSITREYELSVDFLNVRIDKQLMEQTNSLQRGVTGSVAYEMTISRTLNGDESTKTVNGTIELNGDGTALLRFRDVLDIFRIKLDDGSVFEDDEFEGFVRSLNPDNRSFTLFSGQTIFITGQTEIEFEDRLSSFQDIQRSLQNGLRIEAEGSLIRRDDDTAAATEVEFEIESSDGDDGLDFDGVVESVDVSLNSFALRSGLTLYVNEATEFDSDSDISSIQDLRDAMNRGVRVEGDGEYTITDDDRLVVLEVEFEVENNEFEDIVTGADTDNGSVTLSDGNSYFLTGSTTIGEESELYTTEHIRLALSNNLQVAAEGSYTTDSQNRRLLTRAVFKIEDSESDFAGDVQTVSLENRTFQLNEGVLFTINDQTHFSSESDIRTLEALRDTVADDQEVEASGVFLELPDDNAQLVTVVEFNIED